MVDKPFSLDTTEDYVYLIGGMLIVGFLVVNYTSLDAQLRFAATDTAAYFTDSDSNDSLVFEEEMIDNMNWVSQTSFGDALGDERLFCFSTKNNRVTELRFADQIQASTLTSISGGCSSAFGEEINGFVHTQPGGSGELSDEDKSLESPIDYSCIAYREMAVSPVNNVVSGLNCWQVEGPVENPVFESVEAVAK